MRQLARRSAHPPVVAALERALDSGPCSLDRDVPARLWQRALAGPAAEFLARPGKELRTSIVRAGWLLGGGDAAGGYETIALAIELLHAGSLIVDDVEDDSTERRGGPALHTLVGAPLAINTGSWMYFWALAELSELALPASTMLAMQRAALAALVRCHQGQALDLAVRIWEVEPAEAPRIVGATTRLKTGALCALGAQLGALAAGASGSRLAAIIEFGEAVGIGLQMLDDLGSLTSPARRAKGREDVTSGRPTWPWAWLASYRPFAWSHLVDEAHAAAMGQGDADRVIDLLAGEIGEIGRSAARAALHAAMVQLLAALGPSAVTDELAAYLEHMEQSYG